MRIRSGAASSRCRPWFHDGSATGARKVGYGNNWVIAAIVVTVPFLDRPLALPVSFALVHKGIEDSAWS